MQNKTQKIINYFKTHSGIIRFSSIRNAGFHTDILRALEKEGKIEKVVRGIYKLSHHDVGSHPDLVIASMQTPKGIICLLSALAFHEATNEIPRYVDIAISPRAHANRIKYPPVKFYRFAPMAWEAGIEEHEISGHKVRIYSLAKTVADCFKFRNKIGIDVAREALKIAVIEKHVKPKEIMYYAKICRVDSVIKPMLETML
ncbi:MAG: type IV toxin-antitoxin system AbiEi family antitoxin domain-containing protein [Actinobacteria bacterium]|nr:type IV toxin-antitoxin system AbiEi family antitoxin domain-containing protein [Actinomycetota bacterium]